MLLAHLLAKQTADEGHMRQKHSRDLCTEAAPTAGTPIASTSCSYRQRAATAAAAAGGVLSACTP